MFLFNVMLSAVIIGVCTWVAEKRPDLAGFLMSMPLSTMIILVLTQNQYGDQEKTIMLAKSISIAIPATLIFFLPFYFAKPFKLNFWLCYGLAITLLPVGFYIHRSILSFLKIQS